LLNGDEKCFLNQTESDVERNTNKTVATAMTLIASSTAMTIDVHECSLMTLDKLIANGTRVIVERTHHMLVQRFDTIDECVCHRVDGTQAARSLESALKIETAHGGDDLSAMFVRHATMREQVDEHGAASLVIRRELQRAHCWPAEPQRRLR